uniref:Uncharacterized protein n=1 Tax=Romanomermis culicivorax TaxID=13658 RepID=A0A915JRP4_ROMCU
MEMVIYEQKTVMGLNFLILSSTFDSAPLNNNNNHKNNNKKLSIDLLDREQALSFRNLEAENWHDLLWPRPQRFFLFDSDSDDLTPNG